MKILSVKLHDSLCLTNKAIIILVCIIISLMYLQGEHYAQCTHTCPDEIMDFQCSIFSRLSEEERAICSESKEKIEFLTSYEVEISYIYGIYSAMTSFFLERLYLQDHKKRLFTLQRYIS